MGLFHIVGQLNLEIETTGRMRVMESTLPTSRRNFVQVAIGGQAFSQMVEGKVYDIVLRLPLDLGTTLR